ncbi:MAG: UDP-N-acetylmuramoyl-tripeptide--D-alanyl-D-alanine ligase [Planctomycetota bacterium]
MTPFRLRDVLDSTGAVLVRGAAGGEVSGISTDTRSLVPGELFLALSGPNFDGNRFADAAVAGGAAALILRDAEDARARAFPGTVPVAVHADPRRALADLAAWHRSLLAAPVVGITGSCGKTTTKNLIRDLLSPLFPVVASPSSFNNDIGVPHTLLLGDRDTRLFAIEMGTNHPGEIAALCRIARPTAGVITNVGAAHLEGLGSMQGVADEKGDLAASLPRDGFLVLNADCRFMPAIRARTAARVITFSVEAAPGEEGDLNARQVLFHSGGTTFRLNGGEITSPLLGTHNVQNLLAALGVCRGLGVPMEDVLPHIPFLKGGGRRMERIELSGLTVFDDSYNSNPDSLRAAVRVLAGLHGHSRRVLVLGDMLELGELAAELHHAVGREAAEAGIDQLVLVGELAKAAAAGALEGGLPAAAVIHLPTTEDAIAIVEDLVRDGDVVLVKGSRRMRLERLVEHLRVSHGRR